MLHEEISKLIVNQALTTADRDVTLSGLLADGSPFSFNLDSEARIILDELFSPYATPTITLGASPDFHLG